jgi:hypothetical protein
MGDPPFSWAHALNVGSVGSTRQEATKERRRPRVQGSARLPEPSESQQLSNPRVAQPVDASASEHREESLKWSHSAHPGV